MKIIYLMTALFVLIGDVHGDTIFPIPDKPAYNTAKAKLGMRLFYEAGLSKDGTVACASCHQLPGNGADTLPYSRGVDNQEGDVNTPTVLNSRFLFVTMWDGRAKTLSDQVSLPITHPKEMASSMKHAVRFLKSKPDYVRSFRALYRDGITEETVTDAIVEFEKALDTPHSRYDRYLKGENHILTPKELRGEKLFFGYGCISCHNGIAIGGNMYQKIGIFLPYESNKNQFGRYTITGLEKDRYVFRVPSLRNVELTAPYMHDGKAKTLKEAVMLMGIHQLGVSLSNDELESIEAFLKTLTGETPKILRRNDL